jgi:hypothetical protein
MSEKQRPSMVSATGLRSRGWTLGTIGALLGEPDVLKRNMRLYALARIEAAEGSPEFAAAKAKSQGRVAGAREAGVTRRAELLQQVREVQINVKVLPIDVVRRRAIAAYNDRNEDVADDAPEEVLERLTVNYIRHTLTIYDQVLDEVASRAKISEARQAARRRIYEAIAASYPALARECGRQLKRRRL